MAGEGLLRHEVAERGRVVQVLRGWLAAALLERVEGPAPVALVLFDELELEPGPVPAFERAAGHAYRFAGLVRDVDPACVDCLQPADRALAILLPGRGLAALQDGFAVPAARAAHSVVRLVVVSAACEVAGSVGFVETDEPVESAESAEPVEPVELDQVCADAQTTAQWQSFVDASQCVLVELPAAVAVVSAAKGCAWPLGNVTEPE